MLISLNPYTCKFLCTLILQKCRNLRFDQNRGHTLHQISECPFNGIREKHVLLSLSRSTHMEERKSGKEISNIFFIHAYLLTLTVWQVFDRNQEIHTCRGNPRDSIPGPPACQPDDLPTELTLLHGHG